MKKNEKILIGVSSCLLGAKVRFDAGHKKDEYITGELSQSFKFLSLCPEVEIGMGIKRETVRLTGDFNRPKMFGAESGKNWTTKMNHFAKKRISKDDFKNVSGFILKSKSPSCGMENVKVYYSADSFNRRGVGLFAQNIIEQYPYLPIEDESRLGDEQLRENFLVRVLAYYQLQQLYAVRFDRDKFIQFHNEHKYQLMAHSLSGYQKLRALVNTIDAIKPVVFKDRYRLLFMAGLKYYPTINKNVMVLEHLFRNMKKYLTAGENESLIKAIEAYRDNQVKLNTPVRLMKKHIQKYSIKKLSDSTFIINNSK